MPPMDKGNKWAAEKSALKKIQVHFTFTKERTRLIQRDAENLGIKPSDCIRKIVGLPYKKIQRPRIGLSFGQSDLDYLAKKYAIAPLDETRIKQAVTQAVNAYYNLERSEGAPGSEKEE